ncbi:MAG: substrate-binding domain-containing protein [Desulfobacterales bacterium]|nr:substrate-binding domain-containing protein [Desulfobacterales bacterium]
MNYKLMWISKIIKYLLCLLIGIAAILPNMVFCDCCEIIIIANKNVPDSSISKKHLKDIFLGKKVKWKNDKEIVFVTLSKDDVHDFFLKKYLSKTPSQYSNYWKTLVFTGKGTLPKSFNNISALIDFIAKTDGSIGYITSGEALTDVKTLIITDE